MNTKTHNILFISLMILVSIVYIAGIIGDLPYSMHIDEPIFVNPAINIAATGDLNPHWFGNPGSTIIYPLAGVYHVWYSIRYQQPILNINPGIAEKLIDRPSQFYVLGRLLNVLYAVLSIGLTYYLGRKLFSRQIGLLAVLFVSFNTLTIWHAQVVRTDIAAVFWSNLSLIFLIRLYDRPGLRNQILVALAIGFSIGTRYFLGTLIPLLLLVDTYHLFQKPGRFKDPRFWLKIAAGLLAIPVFFFISTPYFFLDYSTAIKDILFEARKTHVGFDGLSPAGNFAYYVFNILPRSIFIPQLILVILGIFLVLIKKQFRALILPIYSLIFLVGISVQSLHWGRWLIPLFPVFAILAAYAVVQLGTLLKSRFSPMRTQFASLILPLLILVASAAPTYDTFFYTIRRLNPSTNIIARDWVYAHIPKESMIITELYTAPKLWDDYRAFEVPISYTDQSAEYYATQGYEYLIVSSGIYDRFYREPERYPGAIDYYNDLFTNYPLLFEVGPSLMTEGPVVRVFKLARQSE